MSGENDSREWIIRHTSENLISDNLVVTTPPVCLICHQDTGSSIAVFARNLFVGKMSPLFIGDWMHLKVSWTWQ